RARKLRQHELSGATFSVSNLGMFPVDEFVAIINPPEGAILAVGAIVDKPVVVDGQLAVGKRMRVTLSADHRVMDGAMGARFLADLKATLEAPLALLVCPRWRASASMPSSSARARAATSRRSGPPSWASGSLSSRRTGRAASA